MTHELVLHTGAEPAVFQSEPVDGLPDMSAELRRMVALFNERNRGVPMPPVTPGLREEAARLLGMVRQAAAPKAERDIKSWLTPINAAVARPLNAKEFAVRADAIAEALAGLPVACFTKATRALVMRSYQWWPSAAEIAVSLAARANAVRDALAALEAFSRPPARPAANALAHDRGTRPESQSERDAVVERFHRQMRAPGHELQSAASVFDPARLPASMRPAGTK